MDCLMDCLMDDGWILGWDQNPCTLVFTSSTVAGSHGYDAFPQMVILRVSTHAHVGMVVDGIANRGEFSAGVLFGQATHGTLPNWEQFPAPQMHKCAKESENRWTKLPFDTPFVSICVWWRSGSQHYIQILEVGDHVCSNMVHKVVRFQTSKPIHFLGVNGVNHFEPSNFEAQFWAQSMSGHHYFFCGIRVCDWYFLKNGISMIFLRISNCCLTPTYGAGPPYLNHIWWQKPVKPRRPFFCSWYHLQRQTIEYDWATEMGKLVWSHGKSSHKDLGH